MGARVPSGVRALAVAFVALCGLVARVWFARIPLKYVYYRFKY